MITDKRKARYARNALGVSGFLFRRKCPINCSEISRAIKIPLRGAYTHTHTHMGYSYFGRREVPFRALRTTLLLRRYQVQQHRVPRVPLSAIRKDRGSLSLRRESRSGRCAGATNRDHARRNRGKAENFSSQLRSGID